MANAAAYLGAGLLKGMSVGGTAVYKTKMDEEIQMAKELRAKNMGEELSDRNHNYAMEVSQMGINARKDSALLKRKNDLEDDAINIGNQYDLANWKIEEAERVAEETRKLNAPILQKKSDIADRDYSNKQIETSTKELRYIFKGMDDPDEVMATFQNEGTLPASVEQKLGPQTLKLVRHHQENIKLNQEILKSNPWSTEGQLSIKEAQAKKKSRALAIKDSGIDGDQADKLDLITEAKFQEVAEEMAQEIITKNDANAKARLNYLKINNRTRYDIVTTIIDREYKKMGQVPDLEIDKKQHQSQINSIDGLLTSKLSTKDKVAELQRQRRSGLLTRDEYEKANYKITQGAISNRGVK